MNKAYILLFFILFNLLIHAPFLNLPPCGSHVWRQCNTLGMSRNFATESMNIFTPRIDRRNETNGITGSHFPLYEWGLAFIDKAFGEHWYNSRLYSSIIFSFGIFAFFLILLSLGYSQYESFLGTLLLSSAPQLYYDSINAMPDTAAFSLSLISAHFYQQYGATQANRNLMAGFIGGLLCGLIKIQFLMVPFSFIVFNLFKRRILLNTIISYCILFIPVVYWYYYAGKLTELNNLREYGLWISSISGDEKLKTIEQNVASDFPELLCGWPVLISFIYSLFLRKKSAVTKTEKQLWILWGLGFLLFYIVVIERFKHHSYYFISLIPLLILIFLRQVKNCAFGKKLLWTIIVFNFIWAMLRIIPSRWTDNSMQIPDTFKHQKDLQNLRSSIPKYPIYIVGPDLSGCIYFYFTNTKGYSFADAANLLEDKSGKTNLETMSEHGARCMIFKQSDEIEAVLIKVGKWHEYKRIGEFRIWTHE